MTKIDLWKFYFVRRKQGLFRTKMQNELLYVEIGKAPEIGHVHSVCIENVAQPTQPQHQTLQSCAAKAEALEAAIFVDDETRTRPLRSAGTT